MSPEYPVRWFRWFPFTHVLILPVQVSISPCVWRSWSSVCWKRWSLPTCSTTARWNISRFQTGWGWSSSDMYPGSSATNGHRMSKKRTRLTTETKVLGHGSYSQAVRLRLSSEVTTPQSPPPQVHVSDLATAPPYSMCLTQDAHSSLLHVQVQPSYQNFNRPVGTWTSFMATSPPCRWRASWGTSGATSGTSWTFSSSASTCSSSAAMLWSSSSCGVSGSVSPERAWLQWTTLFFPAAALFTFGGKSHVV